MAFYLAALAFSLGLIGLSAFLGDQGDHGDGSHGDAGGDHVHSGPLGDLLSLRFLTWGLGGLGSTGAALTLLGVSPALRLPVAIGMGLLVGAGTTFLFRKLRSLSSGSPAAPASLLDKEAVVVMALRPGALGKVLVVSDGQEIEFLARGDATLELPPGTRVVIVKFDGEVAEVRLAPWNEIDQPQTARRANAAGLLE